MDIKFYTTTKSDFEEFKIESDYWIKRFGLIGWDVTYQHIEIDGMPLAQMWYNTLVDRCCSIVLNKQWLLKPNSFDIRRTAFHEVMELFLLRISHMAVARSTTNNELEEEGHSIIRTLETALFDEDYDNRFKGDG